MSVDFLYDNRFGRAVLSAVMKTGGFRIGAWFLNSAPSTLMIPGFIRKNHIDMTDFGNRKFSSFADFFSRKKSVVIEQTDPDTLICPCDSSLSIYTITSETILAMKGSHYRISDLIPDIETAGLFHDGLCLVFRLKETDYHRFHAFDDMELVGTHFIEGTLHSVQPIACESYPVFRLNRRWWTLLKTEHFNTAAQIEIGAMMVGGVKFNKENGTLKRGEEMGYFTLAGSTIVVLLNSQIRKDLELLPDLMSMIDKTEEKDVRIGDPLGRLNR